MNACNGEYDDSYAIQNVLTQSDHYGHYLSSSLFPGELRNGNQDSFLLPGLLKTISELCYCIKKTTLSLNPLTALDILWSQRFNA